MKDKIDFIGFPFTLKSSEFGARKSARKLIRDKAFEDFAGIQVYGFILLFRSE
jgi:hypothetical protein